MKPCPFCGSKDVGYAYRMHPDGRDLAMIACGNCGSSGPVRTYASQWDDDVAEASWDERHNVQAQGRCAALSRSVPWSAVLGGASDVNDFKRATIETRSANTAMMLA